MIQYREDKGSWFRNLFSWWRSWKCDCRDSMCFDNQNNKDISYWVSVGLMYRKEYGPYISQGIDHYTLWYRRAR